MVLLVFFILMQILSDCIKVNHQCEHEVEFVSTKVFNAGNMHTIFIFVSHVYLGR